MLVTAIRSVSNNSVKRDFKRFSRMLLRAKLVVPHYQSKRLVKWNSSLGGGTRMGRNAAYYLQQNEESEWIFAPWKNK